MLTRMFDSLLMLFLYIVCILLFWYERTTEWITFL